jgi:hypothetical protein
MVAKVETAEAKAAIIATMTKASIAPQPEYLDSCHGRQRSSFSGFHFGFRGHNLIFRGFYLPFELSSRKFSLRIPV